MCGENLVKNAIISSFDQSRYQIQESLVGEQLMGFEPTFVPLVHAGGPSLQFSHSFKYLNNGFTEVPGGIRFGFK
jgi:hypothetical protein